MKGATKRTLPEAVRKAVRGEPFDPISDGGIVQDQGKSRNVIFFSYLSRLDYCTYYFLGVICYIYSCKLSRPTHFLGACTQYFIILYFLDTLPPPPLMINQDATKSRN